MDQIHSGQTTLGFRFSDPSPRDNSLICNVMFSQIESIGLLPHLSKKTLIPESRFQWIPLQMYACLFPVTKDSKMKQLQLSHFCLKNCKFCSGGTLTLEIEYVL